MKARSILTLFTFAFIFACSSDKTADLTLQEMTATALGPNGGTAKSAEGALTLSFGPGALTEQTEITVRTIRNRPVHRLVSFVYDLGPHGKTFTRPVELVIDAESANGEELALVNLDGAEPELVPSSSWDPAAGKVRATLEHFSLYAVVSIYNPCENKGCGDVCVICDPLVPTCVEPPPSAKQCNRSDLCVAATSVTCDLIPDAGQPDLGIDDDAGSSTVSMDAGIEEDAGIPLCSDTFTQVEQPKVDILLVVDDSGSMGEEQMTLANSFPLLLDTLVQNNADFHIGVTTTDADGTFRAPGALLGSPLVLTATTPGLAAAFAANVNVGTNGSAFEQGLAAAMAALQPGANPGFVRPDSALTVIYISDEMDQSPLPTDDYAFHLLNFRGPNATLQANAIVGDTPGGCTGPGGNADDGVRYDEVRILTGGAFDSICDAEWPLALTDLGGPGFGYLTQFTLSQPAPSGVASIEINNVPVAAEFWEYDPLTNTVTFEALAAPEPGATIVVFYGC
jgi:hypothetical protein